MNINRKDFLYSLGNLGVFPKTAFNYKPLSNPEYSYLCLDFSQIKNEGREVSVNKVKSFYIGVGQLGYETGKLLELYSLYLSGLTYKISLKKHDEHNPHSRNYLSLHNNLEFLSNKYGNIIFLAGNPNHQELIKAREIILSLNPDVLFTMIDNCMVDIRTQHNESLVLINQGGKGGEEYDLISNLHATICTPGLINLDLECIVDVCAGCTHDFHHIEAEAQGFNQKHTETISELSTVLEKASGCKVLYSYRDAESISIYEINEWSMEVQKSLSGESSFIFCCNYFPDMKADCTANILIET